KGAPSVVTRALVLPPQSHIGTIDVDLRKTFIETSPFYGVYETQEDRESAYEYLAATMNLGRQAAPAMPRTMFTAAPSTYTPATVAPPAATFMVYDPATNSYTSKTLDTMSPLPGAPAVAPMGPAAPAQPQTVTQNVLVLDPTTGQYIQKEMTLAFDPATGQYAPVHTEAEIKATEKARKEADASRLQKEKADARAKKEAETQARREKADALRDERAERARRNDSVLGRVTNTAIQTATRSVVSQLTRGLLGSLTGKR
ncbi:MAG: DUF853 family protein, partial [Eubacteriales bacterium]|nr:DUF853 family protein [Eubacteriales bacterium]